MWFVINMLCFPPPQVFHICGMIGSCVSLITRVIMIIIGQWWHGNSRHQASDDDNISCERSPGYLIQHKISWSSRTQTMNNKHHYLLRNCWVFNCPPILIQSLFQILLVSGRKWGAQGCQALLVFGQTSGGQMTMKRLIKYNQWSQVTQHLSIGGGGVMGAMMWGPGHDCWPGAPPSLRRCSLPFDRDTE